MSSLEASVPHEEGENHEQQDEENEMDSLYDENIDHSLLALGAATVGDTTAQWLDEKSSQWRGQQSMSVAETSILQGPSVNDSELDALSNTLLSDFSRGFWAQTMAVFAKLKHDIEETSHSQLVESERRRKSEVTDAARTIASLQAENDALREAARIDEINRETLADRLAELQQSRSRHGGAFHAYSHWRQYTAETRDRRTRMAAASQHAKTLLVARVFAEWKEDARRENLARLREEMEQKSSDVASEIISRYETKLGELTQELAVYKGQVQSERARGLQLEENLRRTMLRGMTFMNMEAMLLFEDAKGAKRPDTGSSAAPTPLRN